MANENEGILGFLVASALLEPYCLIGDGILKKMETGIYSSNP
jgi:hypothetical protein